MFRRLLQFCVLCSSAALMGCAAWMPPHPTAPITPIAPETSYTATLAKPIKNLTIRDTRTATITLGAPQQQLTFLALNAATAQQAVKLSGPDTASLQAPSSAMTFQSKNLLHLTLSHIRQVNLQSQGPVVIALDLNDVNQVSVKGKITISTLNVAGKTPTDITTTKGGGVFLQSLINRSTAPLTIENIQPIPMTIYDTGTSNTLLRGFVDVRSIVQTGAGSLDIQWVKSPRIDADIRGQTVVRLVGKTNRISASVRDNAALQISYLHAQLVHVFTFNEASASVRGWEQLFIIAKDHSIVKYYNPPPVFYGRYFDQAVILPLYK